MKKLNFKKVTILIWCILTYAAASAQTGVIRGRVSEEAGGETLPGVNVVVKGTAVGTVTDINGDYSIEATSSDVLIFSYVGYATEEVNVSGRSTVDMVLLEDLETLQEIVVLGYTQKDQTQLSSAVTVVAAKQLNNVTTPSAAAALQGKVAGVFVTSSDGRAGFEPDVRIRGVGSADSDSSPLYVVDGLIGGFADPNDIASVTVLKDAGATALYGSRAANGVIIITTKTGESGQTKFDYSVTYGRTRPNLGKFKMMNGQQLYDFHEQINPGVLNPAVADVNADWVELSMRDGIQNRHTLSASGGNERSQYHVSGSYFNDQGVIKKDDFERFGLRLNMKNKLSETFELTSNVGVRGTKGSRGNASSYQAFTNTPFDAPYDADGNPVNAKDTEVNWFGRDRSNFLYEDQYNEFKYRHIRTYADLKLGVNITDWLTFTTSNRGEFEYRKDIENADQRTAGGEADNGNILNRTSERYYGITSNILSTSFDIGAHNISALAGYEYGQTYYSLFDVLNVNHVPGYSPNATQRPKTSSYDSYEWQSSSFLSQIDYGFNDKYFATLSFRRDGSTKFGTNNKYANFWSIGASWIISNEDFFVGLSNQVTYLKLRSSYGKVGNTGISDYLQYGAWAYNFLPSGEVGIEVNGRAPNPDLTWETSKPFDVGLDFTLYDKVDVSVDYYTKKIDGLLFSQQLESVYGYTHQFVNGGELTNKGWEIAVNSTNIDAEITWTTNFNIAFNKAEMSKLTDGEERDYDNQRLAEGKSFGSWYMPKWMGVDPATGDPQWETVIEDANGNETGRALTSDYAEATEQFIGSNSMPDFLGGITNTISYKGLSFSFQFNFVSGNTVYNGSRFYFDHDGSYTNFNVMQLADGWSRWEQPGDLATHPRAIYANPTKSAETSSRFLEDGSYIRLRNIRLDYSIPASLVEKIGLRNASVFASADNLWTITNFTGPDPEVGFNGVSSFPYPVPKKLLVGVSIGF